MRVISVYSMKGGVGKTTAAVNLAYVASEAGARTLLCDLDPQGATSFYLRIRPPRKLRPRRFIRGGRRLSESIRGTDFENFDLLPAHLSFRRMDVVLSMAKRSRMRLAEVLEEWESDYDLVFLDCPPNITMLSENVFYASDHVLVPVIPTTLSVLTYEKLTSFFVDKRMDLKKIVPFFSMVEARKKLHRDTMEEMRRAGDHFPGTVIPYLADIERMGLRREPVAYSMPRSDAAVAFRALWAEIQERLFGGELTGYEEGSI